MEWSSSSQTRMIKIGGWLERDARRLGFQLAEVMVTRKSWLKAIEH